MKKILPILIGTLFIMSGICIVAASSNVAIIDNHPPSAPIINGPVRGAVGIDCTFTFNSTDPDGDNVSYIIDWNDGSNLEITDYYPSGKEITLNHTWEYEGAFSIMAGAIDVHDLTSKPSYWLIGIGKSKNINQIQQNLHQISQIMLSKNLKRILYTFQIQKLLQQVFG